MAELGRPSRRAAALAVVGVVGLLEVHNTLATLGAQARLRALATAPIRERLEQRRAWVAALLRGGPTAWMSALEEVRTACGASEAELFDAAGRRLRAQPRPAPADHWPRPADVARLKGGSLSFGPIGDAGRLFTYTRALEPEGLVLRLATEVPELIDDLRERRRALWAHAAALMLLGVLAALVLVPSGPRPRGGEAASERALDAYAAAIERLRDHGRTLHRRHAAVVQRMSDEIQDKQAMARAGELTAGIVHEIRNGLGTIVGHARLVERAGVSEEVAGSARAIREECETLEVVVRRFMDFVRREQLNLGSFDLDKMLSRVAARESRGRAGAEVVVRGKGGTALVGDEELLERAFENLVRNAREAAGPSGHVWVEASRMEGSVVVTVADDGPGLSPEARAGLRPFLSTKAGGLGLGLPIAIKIIQLHAGELALADRAPRGLRASVRLPLEGPPREPERYEA